MSFIFVILLTSCQQNSDVEVPEDHWNLFDSAAAMALSAPVRNKMEGVYTIEQSDDFGSVAALKWSYTKTKNDSIFHLSIFCEKEISYFILEGKEIGDSIILNGYWRKMDSDETGKARFTVENSGEQIIMHGTYGEDDEEPTQKLLLKYIRPLYNKSHLEVVAHRGGGRNTDFLPASENSIELILRASRFGASGVEVDIQLTKDNIPVLYHDDKINDRLTEKPGIRGPLEDYTYDELKDIKLKKGERIPKLRDALDSILHKTPLQFVWLDAKKKTTIPVLRELQKEYTDAALAVGRKL
ncbi:MAG: glycerophosphodiester phosphodiesterase, partial [Flavisolibacter sp.]